MNLFDGDLALYYSGDREYLSELMRQNKYNCMNDRGIARYVKFVQHLWIMEACGFVRVGVAYFCYIPGIGWTFDGYSDFENRKKLDNRGAWAYKAGVLVLDWFVRNVGEKLYAFVDEENRGAIFMAKKLGFEKQENRNGMIVLRKGFST